MSLKSFLIGVTLVLIITGAFVYFYRGKPAVTPPVSQKKADIKTSQESFEFKAPEVSGPQAESPDLPQVTGVKLELQSTSDKDTYKAIPKGTAKSGKSLTFTFQWTKNDQPAGEGDSISGFKRGDILNVRITPFDGENYGPLRMASTQVANTPPKIGQLKEISADKTVVTYKLEAYDLDGDTLSYALLDAPAEVTIDQEGVIKWSFNKDNPKVSFKIKVTDGHGGETLQSVTFDSVNK